MAVPFAAIDPTLGLGLLCSCVGILVGILGTAFWVWMLIDCLLNEPPQGNEKLVWALVIALTHFLGAALYFLMRRPQRKAEWGR
jgi:hypothetical protein